MRRKITAALALVMCLSALATTPALAHHHSSSTRHCSRSTVCSVYTDANKDGICDNYGPHHAYVDANGDGVCDNWRLHHTCVDANRDGKCDKASQHCVSYVDANSDGKCDHCLKTCAGTVCATTARSGCATTHHSSGHHCH